MRLLLFLPALAAPMLCGVEALQFPTTPPTEASDAAKSFHLLDGFLMQVIAAEPQVTGPVAMAYDEDGRAFVCEMNDYPYTDKAHHKASQENPTDQPIGSVRLLEDTNGDGIFDKSTVFADGLSWPTGVCCWKGGVFVTSTPDIWYLKDTNGDGKADVRQKVFTGFKKLNVQAVMNNPIWGLDHRIYVSGGTNGATITRPDAPDFKPITIKRNDFSFDPNTLDVQIENGGARFGNSFDDWGNRFLCNIRNPCQHVVLPYRYLIRNPYLVVSSALNDCAEAGDQLPVYRTSPPEPWREFRAKRWTQQGVHMPRSELVGAGVVTSSSGITIYRGDAYPKQYRDFAFVNDVAGNLFYRLKLAPDGITFKASQVDANKNFCTSDDLWFRPVNFVNAPDGCLHVCDMYREVIEHPWSIPDDIHASLDLLRGRDRGRIYRLSPPGFKTKATPKLSKATTAELIALLDHPNAWHRDTAHRLLFESGDQGAVDSLRRTVKEGKTRQGRIAALWSLKGLSALSADALSEALHDAESQVRAAAIPLAVDQWDELRKVPDLSAQMAKLAMDPHPEVRVQMALAFPAWSQGVAPARLAAMINSASKDPWLASALLTLPAAQMPEFLLSLAALPIPSADFDAALVRNAARLTALGLRQKDEALRFLIKLFPQTQSRVGGSRDSLMADGAPRIGDQLREELIVGLDAGFSGQGKSLIEIWDAEYRPGWLDPIGELALRACQNSKLEEPQRIKALAVTRALAPREEVLRISASLMKPDKPPGLQMAALEVLGSHREPVIADLLLSQWPSMTPALRDKALTLILSRTDRLSKLLDAIEAKRIPASQINAAARAALARQKDPALAARVTSLLGESSSTNRKAVITKYEAALTMTGDAGRGAKVYETACMVCHRHKDRGNDVGPNLGTVQGWVPEQILTNVLDPNREVSPNFALYIIETIDGRTLTGLIASETGGSLTLKRPDGGQEEILRGDIKSLTSPGISLMPEGLEAVITPAQMADLIAYLREP